MPAVAQEAEPRVVTVDVARIIERALGYDRSKDSVAMIAERGDTSTRTVYRVLDIEWEDISLDLADRLLVAADGHISECTLVWPDEE